MKYVIACTALLVFLVACDNQKNKGDEKQNNKEAADSVNQAKMTKSMELTLAIRENPKKSDLYYQRAKAHVDEQMLLLAMDDIKRALKIDSTSSVYHAYKGEISYMQREPESAVQSFERALELDPKNTDALLKMAEIKLLLRQYQDCFDMANAALRVNDQLFMAYYIKGYAHYELGDSNLFVSSVQTALELNPDFFDGYTMLGAFYASLNSDLALDYYNSALAVRPDDDEALYGKAIYLQNQKRYEEAMELYEYMVSVDDQNTLAWYNQGYIALEINNDPETATAYFERAIELFPEYIDAIYNLGLCYERTGDFDTAQVYYKQALEINPQYDLAALGMERLNR